MLYIKSFNNYDEFNELFGLTEHGNGVKSRKNKILLSLYKDKNLWTRAREIWNFYPFTIANMPTLKQWSMENLAKQSQGCRVFKCLDYEFHSDTYETDNLGGICADGDGRCIRYVKHDDNGSRVYKMKAGKLLAKLIDENPFGKYLNETVRIWLCEEFAADWQAYTVQRTEQFTLHTGSDLDAFNGIYGHFAYKGDFGSCMMNRGNASFFANAISATAAWLTDQDGDMVARAVIYNDARDQDGKSWRLCERQYASGSDDSLKRALVLKLIDADAIDGYKQVGASCWDRRNFVDVNGNSLHDRHFTIDCCLEDGDPVSFMDSFSNYDYDENVADNYRDGDFELHSTGSDCVFRRQGRNYDSWHEEFTDGDVVTVYSHGTGYTCDEDRLDDFNYVETLGEYHHYDDCYWDENRQEYIHEDDAVYCCDGNYHYKDDCIKLYDGSWCPEDNTIHLANGDYAYEDDDDIIFINDDYYLPCEVAECPVCGRQFVIEDGYDDDEGCHYCSEECLEEATKEEVVTA